MKIALVQTTLAWENPELNRLNLEVKISKIAEEVDLIVLPEMFTSGFSMQPKKFAESPNGVTVLWLKQLAYKKNTAIAGSIAVFENNNFYNQLVFVQPNGTINRYNKRHLFTLVGEDKVYEKGLDKCIVEYLGFKICLQICYDLRFPVFSRNTENYDILLYVANWPNPRLQAWNALLKARAIENMCFVVGVNCFGNDKNENNYNGHSQIIDCFGNYIIEPMIHESIEIASISKEFLIKNRNNFPFLNDADLFTISL